MATNFKMPDKKTTIAISVVCVLLLIIAIAGTAVFLKDGGKTEAIGLEELDKQNETVVEKQSSGSEQNDTIQEEQVNQQNQEQPEVVEEQTGEQSEEIQTTTETSATINQNASTVRTDNIQETIIERVETEEIPEQKVSEGHYVGWSPMEVTDIKASSQINVTNNNDIEITKKAITKSGENLVTQGEEIVYNITVKNNGIKDITALEVKDRIPENTTYIENSAVDEAEKVIENGSVIGLIWRVDLKSGEEKTVSFKVTVNDGTTGVITNIALANGEKSEPVQNSIIEASKTAVIEGKKQGESAKVGDKIIYTITVKNTGNIAGKANVKDTELKNLIDNKILEIDEESQEIADKLIEGTIVDVPASGEGTISFSAKVINVNGAIKNIALVGELKPEVIIDTYGLKIEKELTKIERNSVEINKDLPVKNGDILTYTIKVTNVGSTDIKNAAITDELPENLRALTQTTFNKVKIEAGETISKEVKVEVTAINGEIVNIAKVVDEENPDNKGEAQKTINTIDISIDKKAELEKAPQNNKEEYKNIAEVGDIIHYTVSVSNNGSVKLEGLKIVDETMNKENIITLEAGETNSEALKFRHKVVDRDIKVEEGKITYIYNTAAAIYTDESNPDNNVTVNDTEKVEIKDKYEYIVNYLEKDTNKVLEQAKIVTGQIFGTVIQSSSEVKKIEKYKYDSADKESITIEAEENVINLYYITNIDKITLTKVWTQEPDQINTATIRPSTIELQLKAKENGEDVVKYSYSLNTATETSHEFEVEKYDENGNLITYVADESGDLTNYNKSVDGYTITNAYKYTKLVPTKKAYKDAKCTQEVDINNEEDNFQAGETVYYKLSVTNNGKVAGNATVTDDMPSYLENYAIVEGTATLNSSKVTWNVKDLEPGKTESVIVKGTVKQIKLYKDISTKTGNKTRTTAKLFVRKDGLIPYEGSNTPYSVNLYTKCVGTVYLNTSKAIAYGDLSKSDIYDLISRNNNIMNIVEKGISFDELKNALAAQGIILKNDEVVIWYVNKKEDDGWHIDGAIRKISDLQKVTNTLNMVQIGNNEKVTVTADIKLSTIATEVIRSYSAKTVFRNTLIENLNKDAKKVVETENKETIKDNATENKDVEQKEESKSQTVKEDTIKEDNVNVEQEAKKQEIVTIEGETVETDEVCDDK